MTGFNIVKVCCMCGATYGYVLVCAPDAPTKESHGYCPECAPKAIAEAKALRRKTA
uniref:Uncharacterized protein n=1 Tax=viral metagenome TaxID=1070528 RepID=A0A6M3LG43_9ZZZZ